MQNNIEFWAKTTEDKNPGIDVYHHMQNVASVAKCIFSIFYPRISIDITNTDISILSGLHDLGKISPQFQRKCHGWLHKYNLEKEDIRNGWDNSPYNHSQVSQYTIEHLLMDTGLDRMSSTLWAAAIGAHHGRITYNGERGLLPGFGMSDDYWEEKRRQVAKSFIENNGKLISSPVKPDNPLLWFVAGLTTVSDWIGSDERFFPAGSNIPPEESRIRTQEALYNIGFVRPSIINGKHFYDYFEFEANALQTAVNAFIKEPGIYVIEAPMGIGKTEAALSVAYQLCNSGKASGIYFALPTQTTSNRIHLRVVDFINRICEKTLSIQLIHGNSWLLDDKIEIPEINNNPDGDSQERDSAYDWFSSPKRALLSPFGVGTVDQALMGVIAVKHFFVRLFALAGKVVILDEVHSYDIYTGTLINNLCRSLVQLGATVIILSATLTATRRIELLDIDNDEKTSSNGYPLLSGKTADGQILPDVTLDSPENKEIAIRFIDENKAISNAWGKAQNGASIVWICDTIARSQEIYDSFKHKENRGSVEIGLLHSRFPFFRREEIEQKWLEKLGKNGNGRGSCILVATQVVEQSVDIDADLIITELAPTDMLLQRIGRLWRHNRHLRPIEKPELWILKESFNIQQSIEMTSSEIRKALGNKAYVYDPYVLLRTYMEWKKRDTKTILIPFDIRSIIEYTYSENVEPSESWKELKADLHEKKNGLMQKALIATAILKMPSLDDEEEVMTRYNTQSTVSIILARERLDNFIILLNGSQIPRKEEKTGKKSKDTGKAIQKNLVKVPAWVFEKKISLAYLPKYVSGCVILSVPGDGGFLDVANLKKGIRLKWTIDKGLEIIRAQGVSDESSE
ncbi:MAG: CRISPR-associated helicase Cas3' [Spirochaetes bacterium]|jgi:CRISPR-associated endonuclease/helicase Cas3|nr:CRISPR-associated helicase Cas3' [Spirochaetota bacterium]